MPDEAPPPPPSEILFYQSEDGRSRIQVRLEDGSVWLTQRQLADLFQKDVRTINEHIQNILDEGELGPAATIRKLRIVQTEGSREVTRTVEHYNLDVILAIGYRVRSHRGTQFRRWATERLREYLVKGFVLDDVRLQRGSGAPDRTTSTSCSNASGTSGRPRSASTRRSATCTPCPSTTTPAPSRRRQFFQIVQNKLHWAVTRQTAAELIAGRADATKPNMGLTTWKGGKIRKGDVTVAKNYLNEDEIRELNRYRDHVPRLRRGSGQAPPAADNARLAGQAGCLPDVQ